MKICISHWYTYIHTYICTCSAHTLHVHICACMCMWLLYWEREREREYKELAYKILESDKVQDLQSASWRPKRADVILTRVWRSVNYESWSYRPSPKGSRCKIQEAAMSYYKYQFKGSEAGRMPFLWEGQAAVLSGPSTDWMRLTYIRECNPL